jgi:hypothetical protein
MQRFLAAEGFRTAVAINGEEGLRLASELHPSAITLDVQMPLLDGWAVLSTLKSDADLREIPVIMVSITDDRNLGYALGAAEFLTKPIDRERLASVLGRHAATRSPSHVLIAEDDFSTADVLRRTLESAGWIVTRAKNGNDALDQLAVGRPDAILLDLLMPQMDGFELLERLQARDDWLTIPVVIITAKELTAEDHRRLNGSVQSIIEKGAYGHDAVLARVKQQLEAAVGQAAAGV